MSLTAFNFSLYLQLYKLHCSCVAFLIFELSEHDHHTRANPEERLAVSNDTSFFQQLSVHQRLRLVALNDDSPQFQKHLAALQEQVRGK